MNTIIIHIIFKPKKTHVYVKDVHNMLGVCIKENNHNSHHSSLHSWKHLEYLYPLKNKELNKSQFKLRKLQQHHIKPRNLQQTTNHTLILKNISTMTTTKGFESESNMGTWVMRIQETRCSKNWLLLKFN